MIAAMSPTSPAAVQVLLSVVQMVEMKPIEVEGKQRLTFIAPSRGLIGFRSASLMAHFSSTQPCQAAKGWKA